MKNASRASSGFRLPRLKTAVASILLAASSSIFASSYFVVVPVPARTSAAAENINVSLTGYALPAGILGQPYAGFDFKHLLSVTGDSQYTGYGVHWSVVGGALPAGLTLNSDGTLSGTPTAAGTASFQVMATYKTKAGEQAYKVAIANLTVSLGTATPSTAMVGEAYSYDLKPLLSVVGDSSYTGSGVTWTVVSSTLPAGLYLTSDGRIGGTPTAAGNGSITARATYKGINGQQTYQVVTYAVTVGLAGVTPPQGMVGTAYSYDLKPLLSVTGDPAYTGPSQVTWSLESGSLPPGLTLTSDGVISGTPSSSTTASFEVKAAYRTSSGEQTYQLFVANMPANGTLSVTALSFPGQEIKSASPAQAVTMTNTGGEPLSVSGVTGTGPFSVSTTCPASLAPNASCSANAVFQPTSVGPQSGTVVFATGSGNKTVSLSGTGQGTVLTLNTYNASLGTINVKSDGTDASSPTQTVTITNAGNIPTTSLSIGAPSYLKTTNTCGQALAAGSSCSVTFGWAPTSAATLSATIPVTSQDSSVQLTLTGTAVQTCTASPTVVLAQSDTPVQVPVGCGHMQVDMWGAGGGGGNGESTVAGGGGGYAYATGIPVATSTSLLAKVGAGGVYSGSAWAGGGGGGGTFLYINSSLQVAAGGGGGAGGQATLGIGLPGAAGGGATGGTAANQILNGTYVEYGGQGGSQSAGGAGMPGNTNVNCGSSSGGFLTGGSALGGCSTPVTGTGYGGGGSGTLGGGGNGGAGGGGGGYYGGGSGAMGGYNMGGAGGGGGSGYLAPGISGSLTAGSGSTPGNANNSYRNATGAGQGIAGGNGYGGEIVFTWSQ